MHLSYCCLGYLMGIKIDEGKELLHDNLLDVSKLGECFSQVVLTRSSVELGNVNLSE